MIVDEGDWEQIERDTLTTTNAQRVYQLLTNLSARRDRVQTRWIWELLQNARDASPNGPMSLTCSVRHDQAQVLLEHNGRPFAMKEIARVIYHGSTKAEDKSKLGQYGSGLLTTHLLSDEIYVSGKLVDGRGFNFPVRRVPTSIQSIDDDMRESAKRFSASLTSVQAVNLPHGFTTRFRYTVESDAAARVVSQGISGLEMLAPLILAFNEEFNEISVESLGEFVSFNVTERKQLQDNDVQEVTVQRKSPDNWTNSKYLLIEKEATSIAVQVATLGDSTSCLQVADIPRLFLGLPLIGTENFSFPAVINSFQFTPSDEDRDGVNLWLNESDEANLLNQAAVEEACTLLIRLIQFASESAWDDVSTLADVPPIPDKEWLVRKELRGHLTENLLVPLLGTPAVLCEYGEGALPPSESVLPLAEEDAKVEALWGLLSGLKAFRSRLPRRREVVGWNKAVKSWATLSDCDATEFDGVIDGAGFARYIERVARSSEDETHGSLENLQNALVEGTSATDWLDGVLAFLRDSEHVDEVNNRYLVLDQSGSLDRLGNLFRDNDIDEDLKDVADAMGLHLRAKLRDKRLTSIGDQEGKGGKGNQDVIQEVIAELTDLTDRGDLEDDFATASTRAFAWIIENEQWSHLRGFPAFSQDEENGDRHVVWLAPVGQSEDDVPLAPVATWDKELQDFSELFPPTRILSTSFHNVVPNAEAWQKLGELHFTRPNVMVTNKRRISRFLPDEPLPGLEEGARHESREAVELTDIAHLRGDDSVIRRASRSQRRARLFWRFITEWLVVHDAHGLQAKEVSCTCNSDHNYFQGDWLVTVIENNWVPLGNDRHTTATAQSLGRLFRDEGTLSIPNNAAVDRLLQAIGVSRLDLMRESMAVDAQARVSVDNKLMQILIAAENKPDKLDVVPEFLTQLSKDEAVTEYLADRIKQTQKVHRNQQFGNLVERLVKESLEDEGYLVEKTRVGADLVIQMAADETADLSEDDATELRISKDDDSWLVEVKATRANEARMTPTQARNAVKQGDRFLLCVVPVDSEDEPDLDDVKANMRFVGDIGERVSDLCDELDKFERGRGQISGEYTDGVYLLMAGGNTRISIARSIWESDGIPLTGLSSRLSQQRTTGDER